jgi:hypothetical protein
LKNAIRPKTDSKIEAAPNWQAAEIENASNTEVFFDKTKKTRKKETIALVHVAGKIMFKSVLNGPDSSCVRTVGPIHAPVPVKLRTDHSNQSGTYTIQGSFRST